MFRIAVIVSVVILIFMGSSCHKGRKVPLSENQYKEIKFLLDHPSLREGVDLSDMMKASGIVFEKDSKVTLRKNKIIVIGSNRFIDRVEGFVENFDAYRVYFEDYINTPNEW